MGFAKEGVLLIGDILPQLGEGSRAPARRIPAPWRRIIVHDGEMSMTRIGLFACAFRLPGADHQRALHTVLSAQSPQTLSLIHI